MKRLTVAVLCGLLGVATAAGAQDVPAEYKEVLTYLGRSGDFKTNVLEVNVPRSDLSVTVAGVKTPTPFGFGGWLALTKGQGNWGTGPAATLAAGVRAALDQLPKPAAAAKD